MSVIGRIIKINKKSTLLWHNGKTYTLNLKTKHNIGDIIDENDNLITKCFINYNHDNNLNQYNYFKKKFEYIKLTRRFFEERGFLETATNKLKESTIDEANIDKIKTPYGYLVTSPEVEIKKLLSIGFDKLFELNFAYRDDFENNLHKKEFLMLEWYRNFAKPKDIIKDFIDLIKFLHPKSSILHYQDFKIDLNKIEFVSYNKLFKQYAQIDINNFDDEIISDKFCISGYENKLELLDAVFALKIERNLGVKHPVVVYNFPKQRAALSKIANGYAKRYEVYIAGIELGNCYDEENDYQKLIKRFNNKDKEFFKYMAQGIPNTSGIAVGFERLIMLLENLTSL